MSQKAYNFDPRAIPAELLAAIGEVAVALAHTEYVVELAMRGYARSDAAATKGHDRSDRWLDDALKNIALAAIGSDDRAHLVDLLDEIKGGFRRGAIYIRNSVCLDPSTGSYLIAKRSARGELSGELVPVTISEIRAEADFIYQAGLALLAFLMQNKLLPAPRRSERPAPHKVPQAKRRRTTRVAVN